MNDRHDVNEVPEEGIPLDLQRFVSAEAARPLDEAGKDAMRDRLAVSLGLALSGAGVATAPSALQTNAGSLTSGFLKSAPAWVKATVLLAVGFGAGFGSRVALERSPASPVASPSSSVYPVSTARPLATEASSVIDSIDVANLPSVVPSTLPAPSGAPSAMAKTSAKGMTAEDAEAERLLLETARVALRRGDKEGALALLEQHKRRFPGGQLREERDGLMVSALSQLGRTDEAAKAASRFRKDYPMSLQGAAMPSAAPQP